MGIEKVAVIGSGVMGSGIAGQIANAGVEVVLLDIVPKDAENRNIIAETAVQKMLKTEPAPLMRKSNAKYITTGNIEDHLDMIATCDWVIEVVLENLEIKQNLYKEIETHRKPDCVVSSNTSSIPLQMLVEGRSDSFKKHFMITHFFNPPRYMRLLELVTGVDTDAQAAERIQDFCDIALGKGVVHCHDTPGFIANRIGAFWLQCGLNEAFALKVGVEEADAVMSRPVGIPKTGVFGLMDLVGIDLMPHLAASLLSTLPDTDMYAQIHQDFDLIPRMIAEGYTGRKGKGGFYRLNKSGGKPVKEAIDLQTGAYAPDTRPAVPAVKAAQEDGLRALVTYDDKTGAYAWSVLSKVLTYSASLVPEIADNIYDVDQAMCWGYNWGKGPFQLIDALGADWFVQKLEAEGVAVPPLLKTAQDKGGFYREHNGALQYLTVAGDYQDIPAVKGVLSLADIKRRQEPVHQNDSAALWDIGDGVLCLEFTSKMNALDLDIMQMIYTAIETIEGAKTYSALVIYNDGDNFSVGANLKKALDMMQGEDGASVDDLVKGGQQAYKALKFSKFPVVSAPAGMALGGGCEMLLHSDAVQPHAELYCGLVEVGVGIIPGWGGCKEMLLRHFDAPMPNGPVAPIGAAFQTIGTAQVSKSAAQARDLHFLNKDDCITMNRSRVLSDAKARALDLAQNYTAPEGREIRLPGETGKLALMMMVDGLAQAGRITPHDVTVSEALALALTGCDSVDMTDSIDEDGLLSFEYDMFMRLVKTPETLARIEHMMTTGKPLRN